MAVNGGEVGAKSTTLTFMVGGTKSTFNKRLPCLQLWQLVGKKITHASASGRSQATPVAHQIVEALNIAAQAEALVFASKAGAAPAQVRQALKGKARRSAPGVQLSGAGSEASSAGTANASPMVKGSELSSVALSVGR